MLTAAGNLSAQEQIIYPAQDQSQEQQDKDKFECYSWAKGQSGFDPMAPARTTDLPQPSQEPQGDVVRGAGRGAAMGAVGGAIVGDAGTGAAVGAATGALSGVFRRRDRARHQRQSAERQAEQQAAAEAKNLEGYNRAYSACLEGRGYTVK